MSQSLYTAMGGIAAAQTQLNVVSNNIANLNTTAFKGSSVNFSDVFYTTISSGTGASTTTGGTNPIQVGLGTQVSSVSKDFSAGTWVSTGRTTDMMIEGNGFFSVQSPDKEIYYTRAGDFSFDSDGDLVTSDGYKVLGTDKLLSQTSSLIPVHIPQIIDTKVTANVDFYDQAINTLNNCRLTAGDFKMAVNGNAATTLNVDTETYTTMQELAGSLQNQIGDASDAATALATTYTGQATIADGLKTTIEALNDGDVFDAATYNAVTTAANNAKTAATTALAAGTITQAQYDSINNAVTSILANRPASGGTISAAQISALSTGEGTIDTTFTTAATNQTNLADAYDGITVVCDDTTNGTIQFRVDGTDARSITFSSASSNQSNFLSETGLGSAKIDDNVYTSDILDYKVSVTEVTSPTDSTKLNGYSIGDDGSIEATYANGDTLSVKVGADGNTYEFVYTTAENVVITGNNVGVDNNLALPANFVMQLASITNTDGLIANGSNLYAAGPNSGKIIYSVGDSMGIGSIASGGLEASNVDLSKEFSSMILAQRAVQANSRVFSTTSDIMDVVVNMGR